MFASIKVLMVRTDRLLRIGSSCTVCGDLTDDELIVKLRSYFSYAPSRNEAREELRQLEHESISVYIYRRERALYRSSGIHPENERHPHIIKDFISRRKISEIKSPTNGKE